MDISDNRHDEFKSLVRQLLVAIGEDPDREGLIKTPERVAKAYNDLCSGYSKNPSDVIKEALFESSTDEMVVVRDIEFYSLCEHHLLPFFGRVSVAYIPDGRVVGLSKLPRVVELFARRLQLQERLTEQIADAVMQTVQPKGVGVAVSARHMCMEMRGVQKAHAFTTTSALRGIFLSSNVKEEFFSIINAPIENRF